MTTATGVWLAIAGYCVLMLAIGALASRRTHDAEDFFLGGRKLGAWVAALSQGATQSSAWTLIGVSGAAFAWGLSAIWIWISVVAGYAVNWLLLAPRLRRLSARQGSVTLVQLLTAHQRGGAARRVRLSASLIIVASFLFYVAAQFQAAGAAFALALGLDPVVCVLAGATLIVTYTLLGGFWAASLTDFAQGALMLLVAVVLPVAAVVAVGGPEAMTSALTDATARPGGWFGGREGLAAAAFVVGTMGIGLAAPGQPHVVNHFMAARDEQAIRRGGVIALVWIALVLAGMLVVGWSGRLLMPAPARAEDVLLASAIAWLPAIAGGFVTVAVMAAIMSTVDSQLLTATSSMTVDLDGASRRLTRTRIALVTFSVAAALIAIYAPESIYTRVLFAWNALGAAFGPLVLLAVLNRPTDGRGTLACLWTGFLLTILFYLAPDSEGDVLERVVPFVAALCAAVLGSSGARSSTSSM